MVALSGCSWNVLEPLLESGCAPFLESLVRDAGYGVLESSIPYQTGAAWASYATGSFPGRHGVHDTLMPTGGRGFRRVHARDLGQTTYYQQLSREGKRSVFVNLPLDQGGCEGAVIVNSWLTEDDAQRLLPVGRRNRYRRLLGAYKVAPKYVDDVDELCSLEQARFDLTRELYLREEWDHFFVLFSASDWIAQLATGSALRGDQEAQAAFRRVYRQLDGYLRWLVEHAGDALTFVLSEYGRTEELAVLRVNSLLHRLGLVTKAPPGWNAQPKSRLASRSARRKTVMVPGVVGRHTSGVLTRNAGTLAKAIARRGLGVELTGPSHEVDFASSRAYMPTDSSFGVFLPQRDDELLASVGEALLQVTVDGKAAVNAVWSTEELWGRAPRADEPALIIDPAPGVRPSAAVRDREVEPPPRHGSGCQQRAGVLIMSSSAIPSSSLGTVSICDVAPTILWAMGSAVPAGTDGRVLLEAFSPEAAEKPIASVSRELDEHARGRVFEETDEVTRRLQALGYI